MPHLVLFQFLLFIMVCVFTWAAPLISTSSSLERRCVKAEKQSGHNNEHQSNHYDDKMCVISSIHLASSTLLQEPRETADIKSSAKSEEISVPVTDDVQGHIKQMESLQSDKSYTQYHEQSTEPTAENLDTGQSQKLSTPFQYESFALVDHALGPGNENTVHKPFMSPENYVEHKLGPPILPVELQMDISVQTQATLENSEYTSLHYSDVKEGKENGLPLTEPHPLKHHRGWGVKISPNQFDELTSSTEVHFSMHTVTSQSPKNADPVVTALTTSSSYDEHARESSQDKEGVSEVNLFTAEEQDKASVSGLLQPDLALSSRLTGIGDTWTEPAHLQGAGEASVVPLLQEISTEATMSSEGLPLIFEPSDDVTPSSSVVQASELSVAMMPTMLVLGETEVEQTLSMDTDHSIQHSVLGPSDWPLPWQMSGAENSDTASSSQMPNSSPFSEADVEHDEKTERIHNTDVLATSVNVSPSPVSTTTHKFRDLKSTHSAVSKPASGLEELKSQENDNEEDEYADESDEEEEESEEELTDIPVQAPTRPPYILIPPSPVWGQRNQGLIRSWVKLIREKAGYVSGMLAPVGIGIAGALLIVGALYGIRMIHRKRKNSLKHQRRKQPAEVRSGPDQAMLLADSSEDEF